MFETSDDEFYMLIDDSNNRPLTDEEKEHMKWVESQQGYKESMAEAEAKAKRLFGL